VKTQKRNRNKQAIVMVEMEIGINVRGDSLEESLSEARKLKWDDCVSTNGEVNDAKIEIIGIYEVD